MRALILCLWLACPVIAQAQTDAKEILAEARELARAGRHADAIERYERLTAAVEQQLGGKSLALVFVLRELAEQHHALGDMDAAEPLYRRSLEVGEANSEAEPAILVPSLRGLAALTAGRGQLAESEALYTRALDALEKAGASDSQDAARTLAELGLLAQLQAQVEASESFYTRALAAGEASGLPEVELATIVNNLGALCAAQDRGDEAEPFYRRALAMRERALGADHPQVAFVAYELARLYDQQGRWDEATPLYERTLRIREAAGEDGMALSDLLTQLAAVSRRLNRPEEAESYFRRTAEIAEENLGPDHPMVALRLNNLAVLYSDQARFPEAEKLYRRALEIEEKAFGPDHVSVAVGLTNLASLHHRQGRLDDAVAEAGRAATILQGQCAGGEVSDFCHNALRIHRQLQERLASSGAETTPAPAVAAPPRAPAPVPAVETGDASPERVYRAQVAARKARGEAEQELEKLRVAHPLIAGLRHRIVRVDLGEKGVWHRIQLGEFPTGAQAQGLCSELTRQGHEGCFVVATAAP